MYDIMKLEHQALRDLTEEELADAPLLVLACGHVFPTDSLDGLVPLWEAYERDDSGAWTAAKPLRVGTVFKQAPRPRRQGLEG